MRSLYFVPCAMLMALPASAQSADAAIAMHGRDGANIGHAKIVDTPNGVLISLQLKSLSPGAHAIHFHEKGVCAFADGFESAGDHFNPHQKQHGVKAEGGMHAGDMPNQMVENNGTLIADIINPNVRLESGNAALRDADGTALVLHAGADDYVSQTSGNSGDRIACGVIAKKTQPGSGNR